MKVLGMLESEKYALSSGLIIGEGCFNLQKSYSQPGGKGTKKYLCIYPRLAVVNCDKPILEFLADSFGGKIEPKPLWIKDKPNASDCYKITWYGPKILEIIKKIKPYLIGKKRKSAEIMERYIESRIDAVSKFGTRYAHYTEDQLNLVKQLADINKRGRNKIGHTRNSR